MTALKCVVGIWYNNAYRFKLFSTAIDFICLRYKKNMFIARRKCGLKRLLINQF